jgi:hypothetical protein
VADAAEASASAGIPVRLPTSAEGELKLEVQPGAKASFKVDLPKMRALLKDIGRDDLQLPDAIDGAQVTMDLPTAVLASYGKCEMTAQELAKPVSTRTIRSRRLSIAPAWCSWPARASTPRRNGYRSPGRGLPAIVGHGPR